MAGEYLATLEDINVHLPEDKIGLLDSNDDLLQIDIARVVRGYLAGIFPAATLATWTTPPNVPEEIRAIAGRLIAAKYYAERYSEDVAEVPEYAQRLWDEGMQMLRDVRAGIIVLPEVVTEVIVSGHLNDDDFWPNGSEDPKFTMNMQF